jgi:hypothetical protein
MTFDKIRRIAFGWLGLKPTEFYEMEITDFFLMCDGFFEKRKSDDISFAKVAFYIAAIHQNIAGKPLYGKKFIAEWFGEKEKQMTQEELNKQSIEIMKRVEVTNKILEEREKKNKQLKNLN